MLYKIIPDTIITILKGQKSREKLDNKLTKEAIRKTLFTVWNDKNYFDRDYYISVYTELLSK